MEILKEGNSAIDAVEAAIKVVEDNSSDWSVGYGGFPNLQGEVELDASIMDGRDLNAGAVAGIKKYKHPIAIARKVMEDSQHVMLIGEGAETFADIHGFKQENLLTDRSRKQYRRFEKGKVPILTRKEDLTKEERKEAKKWMKEYLKRGEIKKLYQQYNLEKHGTVNVIAKDKNGDICTGVSTSGIPLKLPGRVGDSPIIGAGNYADNRAGGIACVGHGELAIRGSTAKNVSLRLKQGETLKKACTEAIKDLAYLKTESKINILALDSNGNITAVGKERQPTYYVMEDTDNEAEKRKGIEVQV